MEWIVVCGRGLAAAKGIREVTDVTYLGFGPKGEDLAETPDELLFVLLRPTERSRVGDLAEVLGQIFGEDVHILLFESFAPCEDEFDLWGGAF